MMSGNRVIMASNAFIYMFVWMIFTTLSSGTAVPSGIFMPMIIIGCSAGILYSNVHYLIFPGSKELDYIEPSIFAILGASSVLSGSTRMTYSLAVIMLETSSNIDLFLPIIFTLFVSYGTGTLVINKSIYLGALRTKNIPLLTKSIPKVNSNKFVTELMATSIKSFHFITTVEEAFKYL
jgi:chloride channel 7